MPPGTLEPPLGNDSDNSPAAGTKVNVDSCEYFAGILTKLIVEEWFILCSSTLASIELYDAVWGREGIPGRRKLNSVLPSNVIPLFHHSLCPQRVNMLLVLLVLNSTLFVAHPSEVMISTKHWISLETKAAPDD